MIKSTWLDQIHVASVKMSRLHWCTTQLNCSPAPDPFVYPCIHSLSLLPLHSKTFLLDIGQYLGPTFLTLYPPAALYNMVKCKRHSISVRITSLYFLPQCYLQFSSKKSLLIKNKQSCSCTIMDQ